MRRTKTTRLQTKKRHGKSPKKKPVVKKNTRNNRLLIAAVSFGVIFGLILTALIFALPDPAEKKLAALRLKQAPADVTIDIRRTKPIKKAVKPPVPSETQNSPVQTKGKIAIIIDDVGHDWDSLRALTSLPKAVTLAMLPYVSDVQNKAKFAQGQGHELLVHLPMAPKSNSVDPGPMALQPYITKRELAQRIQWNLSQFDGYIGVNNHMGSLFTEDRPAMKELFARLKERDVMFIDSRTTAQSAGALLADQMAIPYAERDVFLDNAIEATAVEQQLRTAEQKALENGNAIAIGHPHIVTVAALEGWVMGLEKKGIRLVPVSDIIKERGTALWRAQLRQKNVSVGYGGQ